MIGGAALSPKPHASRELNDVWACFNEKEWVLVNPKAAFPPRANFAGLVFNDRLWVIGGDPGDDAWSSAEGAEWVRATDHVGSPHQRISHAVVLKGRLWAVGDGDITAPGRTNHVWSSTDGASWTPVAVTQGFPPREYFTCLAFDDKIWVIGGDQRGPSNKVKFLNDAWYSSDGAVWTQVSYLSAPAGLAGQAGLVFNGQMWMIGGENGGNQYQSDVWETRCDKGNPPFHQATKVPYPLKGVGQ